MISLSRKIKIGWLLSLALCLALAFGACSKAPGGPTPHGDAEGVQGDPVPAFECVALQAGALTKISHNPSSETVSLYGADAVIPAALLSVAGATIEGDVKVITGDELSLRIDTAQELNDGSYRSTLTVTGHSLDGTYDLGCQIEQH